MAQQVNTLALPTVVTSETRQFLDTPSSVHGFLISVVVGVLLSWGFAIALAMSFKAYLQKLRTSVAPWLS